MPWLLRSILDLIRSDHFNSARFIYDISYAMSCHEDGEKQKREDFWYTTCSQSTNAETSFFSKIQISILESFMHSERVLELALYSQQGYFDGEKGAKQEQFIDLSL